MWQTPPAPHAKMAGSIFAPLFDALWEFHPFVAIGVFFAICVYFLGIWGAVYVNAIYLLPLGGLLYWLAHLINGERQNILWLEFVLAFYIAFATAYSSYLKHIERKDDDDEMLKSADESWISPPAANIALCAGAFSVMLFSLFVKFVPSYAEGTAATPFVLFCGGFIVFGYMFVFCVQLARERKK